jgi:hypothetical protein
MHSHRHECAVQPWSAGGLRVDDVPPKSGGGAGGITYEYPDDDWHVEADLCGKWTKIPVRFFMSGQARRALRCRDGHSMRWSWFSPKRSESSGRGGSEVPWSRRGSPVTRWPGFPISGDPGTGDRRLGDDRPPLRGQPQVADSLSAIASGRRDGAGQLTVARTACLGSLLVRRRRG